MAIQNSIQLTKNGGKSPMKLIGTYKVGIEGRAKALPFQRNHKHISPR